MMQEVLEEDEVDVDEYAFTPQMNQNFRVPHGYEMWADGTYRLNSPSGLTEAASIDLIPPQERRKNMTRIAGRPMWLSRFGVDKTTGNELVELSYTDSYGVPQTLWVTRDTLAIRHHAVRLSARGVPVHDGNIKDVQYYWDKAINLNAGIVPRVVVTSRAGAYSFASPEGDTGYGWLFGRHWIGPDYVSIVLNEQTVAPHGLAYAVDGDEDQWRAKWLEVTSYGQVTRWLCYSPFAAPLLRHIMQRSFVVHHWGPNSIGKSATARFALSAWGDPACLETPGVNIERAPPQFAAEVDDLPVFIDDLNLTNTKNPLKFVHDLSLSRRRTVARQGGPVELNELWHSVLYTTGSNALYEEDTYEPGSLSERVIQLGASDIPRHAAEQLYGWSDRRCFGWGGYRFLEALAALVNQPGGTAALRDRYNRVRTVMAARSDRSELPRSQSFAAVALAESLVLEWFFGHEETHAINFAVSDALRVVRVAMEGVPQLPLATRALQLFAAETTANHKMWLDLTTPKQDYSDPFSDVTLIQQGKWGQISGVITPQELWMLGPQANELLKRNNMKPRDVWSELERVGALVTYRGPKNQAYTVNRSKGHFTNRVYAIRRSALDAALTDGQER